MNSLPLDIYNLISNNVMKLPFFPKFLVSFSNIESQIDSYNTIQKYYALKDIIRMVDYQHIKNIYMKNELTGEEEFSLLKNIDIRGDRRENIKYEIKSTLYVKEYINEETNIKSKSFYIRITEPEEYLFKIVKKGKTQQLKRMKLDECDELKKKSKPQLSYQL